MSEDVWAVAVEELEVLFSRAERLFLNHFSRIGKDEFGGPTAGYGGAVIKSGSKEYREGVLKYMWMLLKIREDDYWLSKLRFDVKRFELGK